MILKAPFLAVALLASGLLAIPVVIGGNGSGAAAACGELAVILDTIRTIESGGNYSGPPNRGGASGAYQYIDATDAEGVVYVTTAATGNGRAMLGVNGWVKATPLRKGA